MSAISGNLKRRNRKGRDLSQLRICSRHFISAALIDDCNPDWLPTQHIHHQQASVKARKNFARNKAKQSRAVISDASIETAHEMIIDGGTQAHTYVGSRLTLQHPLVISVKLRVMVTEHQSGE